MAHVADINYLAVIIAAVVSFIIGGLWYGPIFGKLWMNEIGKTEEELKEGFNPAKTYGLAFIGQFVMSYVLARLMSYTGVANLHDALTLAFLCWIGLSASSIFINYLFNSKSFKLLFIDTGYFLINIFASAIIIYLI